MNRDQPPLPRVIQLPAVAYLRQHSLSARTAGSSYYPGHNLPIPLGRQFHRWQFWLECRFTFWLSGGHRATPIRNLFFFFQFGRPGLQLMPRRETNDCGSFNDCWGDQESRVYLCRAAVNGQNKNRL